MNRITKYSNDIIRNKAINILRKIDHENGLNGDELAVISAFCLIERTENRELKRYEDLEEQEKLLKLPCAVGDTVYIIDDIENEFERTSVITEISIEDGNEIYIMISDGFQSGSSSSFGVDDFGKTVFLTREEAEAALEGLLEVEDA